VRSSSALRSSDPRHAALRLSFGVLLIAAAWAALVPAHGARAAPVPDYRQVIAEALQILDEAADADEIAQADALGRASRLLAAVDAVETGSGRHVTLSNPPLRARLAEGNLRGAEADLRALLDAVDAALAAGAPAPGAREHLATVLARPEFRVSEPGVVERLLGPALEPLGLAWERFWRAIAARLGGAGEGSGGWLWLLLGGLVVGGLAALMLGAFSGSVVSGARTADGHRAARDGPQASRARAYELAARGNYRAAVHELHLATLLALDERRLLRFRAHLTNREHLDEAQVVPRLRHVLVPEIDAYDRLWYSGGPIGPDEWQGFATLAEAAQSVTNVAVGGAGRERASERSESL
jgi:hypothetical protein